MDSLGEVFKDALLEVSAFTLINLIIDFEKKMLYRSFILLDSSGMVFSEGFFFLTWPEILCKKMK